MDIITGEKLSSTLVASMELIHLSSRRGGYGVKGVDEGYHYFSPVHCEFHFIRENENLV